MLLLALGDLRLAGGTGALRACTHSCASAAARTHVPAVCQQAAEQECASSPHEQLAGVWHSQLAPAPHELGSGQELPGTAHRPLELPAPHARQLGHSFSSGTLRFFLLHEVQLQVILGSVPVDACVCCKSTA